MARADAAIGADRTKQVSGVMTNIAYHRWS